MRRVTGKSTGDANSDVVFTRSGPSPDFSAFPGGGPPSVAVAGYEESSVLLPRDAEATRHRFSGRRRL